MHSLTLAGRYLSTHKKSFIIKLNPVRFTIRFPQIIIAYPKNKKNSEILKQIKKYKVEHFGGSENNVLDRFYKTAKNFYAKNIFRISADCPFADPKLIDKLAKKFFHFKLFEELLI